MKLVFYPLDASDTIASQLFWRFDQKGNAIHIGHSTGGGEVIHYVAKHGKGRVAKAILISAVTPLMVQSKSNPDGVPMSIFDEIREGTAFNRAQYFQDFTLPFYGYNRPGAKISQGVRDNWWRQG